MQNELGITIEELRLPRTSLIQFVYGLYEIHMFQASQHDTM